MLYVGIDPSLSGLGLIAVDDRGEIVYRRRLTSKPMGRVVRDRINRYLNAAKSVIDALLEVEKMGPIACMWIEAYAFNAQSNRYDLGEFGGILRWCILAKWPTMLEEISNNHVKKFATGKGNAVKEEVIAAVAKKWGYRFENSDEADAYVLARMSAVAYAKLHCPPAEFEIVQIALGLQVAPSKVAKTKAALKKKERAKKLAQQKRFANMIEKKKERAKYGDDFPF